MRRKSIVALILVGVICPLAIAGFTAYQKFLSQQSFRNKVVEVFSQCVKGEVTVGKVDFNPFRGITIKELNFSDPTAENKKPILKASMISIEYSPLHLLVGKIFVKGITIASPEVFIVKDDKGGWNIRELIRPDFKWPFTPVEGSLKDGIVIKDAVVDLKDAALLEDAPKPISDIQVFLIPSPESIRIFNISGNIDDKFWGTYSFGGRLNIKKAKFNLNIMARNIFLREELVKRVPSVGAKLWGDMAPSGRVNLTCAIKYDKYADKRLYYDFVADLTEGTFKLKQWPLPVHGLTGTVELCNGCLYLKNLKGNIGNTEDNALISLNGDICLDERGGILTVDVLNVTGTEELIRMIPKVGDRVWTDYKPTGRADVSVTCIVKGNEVKPDSIAINLRDANATYIHWPLPVHGITGRLEIAEGRLYMKKLHGYVGEGQSASLDLHGQTSLKEVNGIFNINVSNINVTEKIVKMIPSLGDNIWSEYGPEGRCDAAVTCNVKDKKVNYEAIIDLRDMKLLGDRLPFPIVGVNGRIEYSENNLYLRDLNGYVVTGMLTNDKRLSTAHFDLDGTVGITASSGLLTFETTNLAVGEPLVRNIPVIGEGLWETIQPRGRVDVHVDYQIDGRNERPELYAEINCKEMEILCPKLPVPVSNLSGFIETDGNVVYTRELRGRTCNGDVSAVLGVDLSSHPIQYKLKLHFTNTDLGEFMKVALKSDKQLSGLLSGQTEFYCKGNGTENISGKGEINLRKGNLFDIPVILSLCNLLNLSLPEKDTFHSARVEYAIANGIVHIERARLISDTVEISGTGDVGLDGKLDMLAIVEFRNDSFVSGIPIVGEVKDFLIGGIVRRLTKFEIKGTVTDPKTKTVSLKALKHPSIKNVFELLKHDAIHTR